MRPLRSSTSRQRSHRIADLVSDRQKVSPEKESEQKGSSPKIDSILFFVGVGLLSVRGLMNSNNDEALVFLWVETSASHFMSRIYF